MAVIVKYIVVRNGEEKMTFATKKEADAYDKMLDIADNLFEFLDKSDIKLSENQMEEISLLLAQKRDALMPILRGINPKKQPKSAAQKPAAEKSGAAAKPAKSADNPAAKQKPAKK
ncbi:MAG: YebG family protein [Desulfotignum sp.]|nr:YebG family protein [Desulfotignum sp.]MCF8125839.1 YebG family protein [Desulfotignum sp.]